MKKYLPYTGIFLIFLGTIVLAATRIFSLTSLNSMLLIGLILIIAGIVIHIRSIKHESRY